VADVNGGAGADAALRPLRELHRDVHRATAVVVRHQQDLLARQVRLLEALRQVKVEAGIAVQVVIAAVAVDRVIARAASKVIAVDAAGDRVVARPAVDRHQAGRRGRVNDVVARARENAPLRQHRARNLRVPVVH
jgi:hypothetical protein